MITRVTINDNANSPLYYLPNVFKNGTKIDFKGGVNVIVGENGCGKSTLLRLIETYLLINKDEQNKKFISRLYDITDTKFKDGVDVKSDYMLKTFRFCHLGEMTQEDNRALGTLDNFIMTAEGNTASTGEGITIAINTLWGRVFNTDLSSPMIEIVKHPMRDSRYEQYTEYIKRNAIPYDKDYEVTILLDEPDRNLDIFNLRHIYGILSERKEHTQLIAVIHNPLLIHRLSMIEGVNIIELSKGYLKKIEKELNKYIGNK